MEMKNVSNCATGAPGNKRSMKAHDEYFEQIQEQNRMSCYTWQIVEEETSFFFHGLKNVSPAYLPVAKWIALYLQSPLPFHRCVDSSSVTSRLLSRPESAVSKQVSCVMRTGLRTTAQLREPFLETRESFLNNQTVIHERRKVNQIFCMVLRNSIPSNQGWGGKYLMKPSLHSFKGTEIKNSEIQLDYFSQLIIKIVQLEEQLLDNNQANNVHFVTLHVTSKIKALLLYEAISEENTVGCILINVTAVLQAEKVWNTFKDNSPGSPECQEEFQ
ncbi:hypothetical protein EK904_002858, partial [Melospiza melodia maxima]